MGIQEWTIILGVVVGVAILFWLAARWRKRRYEEIFSYDSSETGDVDLEYGSELPSGGARTVGYRDATDIERMNDEIRQRADSLKPRLSSYSSTSSEQQALFSEPKISESEMNEVEQKKGSEPVERQVPLLLDPSDEYSDSEDGLDDSNETLGEIENQPEQEVSETEVSVRGDTLKSLDVSDHSAPLNDADKPKPPESEKRTKLSKKAESKTVKPKNTEPREPAEIIVVNLMTTADSPYQGAALWHALNELGMRFGEMDIFHYCGKQGDEPPQFRMANLLNPGIFDVERFDQLRTHALCFFFELEPEQDNIAIYDSMLWVISQLKDELGGEMRDDQRSVFTIQTSEHCRNKIRDFQRRHLVRKG